MYLNSSNKKMEERENDDTIVHNLKPKMSRSSGQKCELLVFFRE